MVDLKHPENILIKNDFYPNGLTEEQVWSYYQDNKQHLLNEVRDRDIIVWISTDVNKLVVKRNISGKPIKLTNANYNQVIHGRVISVHSVMKFYEDICIIDIDSNQWGQARQATEDVYNSVMNIPFINKSEIYYTGKTSFHIKAYLSRPSKIESIKFLLSSHFKSDSNLSKYTLLGKRTTNVPNIDLAPNKLNGSFITPYSLSVIGLKCMKVNYNELQSFNPLSKAIIK